MAQVLSVVPSNATLSLQQTSWTAAGRLPQGSHASSITPAAALAPQQDWMSASVVSDPQSSASSNPRPAVSGRAAAAVLQQGKGEGVPGCEKEDGRA